MACISPIGGLQAAVLRQRRTLTSQIASAPLQRANSQNLRRLPRQLVITAASPPTNEVSRRTEPLTEQDLVNYLASGCKPKEKWLIGTEHEKFGFDMNTLQPATYDQIASVMHAIAERFEWEKVMEGSNIIGLTANRQSVSLEPGGQLELSGAPLQTVHQTCAEVNNHLYQVKAVAEDMNLGFLGMGFNPKNELHQVPIMPKGRYEIMRNYMPRVGSLGLEMMFRTCTVQVNLDFESEEDMINKFRVGLALQPIATALFANSPFTEGKPNGYLSYRSFEKYTQYALDVPMYFVYRNQKYIDASGLSFRDFLAGKLSVCPGDFPTLDDWENHLTTIFPEVRLKRYLEMRGADGGPWKRLCALPAFWVGLLYDAESLQGALDLIADWTDAERAMMRRKVPVEGLQMAFRDGMLKHVAQEVFKLSQDGLRRRGFAEESFLDDLKTTVESGITPAERLLELYHNQWGQKVDSLYTTLLY